jgi:hypothetical protein
VRFSACALWPFASILADRAGVLPSKASPTWFAGHEHYGLNTLSRNRSFSPGA